MFFVEAAALLAATPSPVGATVVGRCAALAAANADIQAQAVPPGRRFGSPVGGGEVTAPGFCQVTGTLHPVPGSRIGFTLWLPEVTAWTGRFQMLGNGGYSSTLPLAAMAGALARGTAVVATDTGHDGDDPDFARGHPEAIVDWAWRAVHSTAVAAKPIIARYYGRSAAHSYFDGCSTGGHQAMMEAQRFPKDFDGIVAGAPGSDRVRLNAAFLWQFLSNHKRAENNRPLLDQGDLRLLASHSLQLCRRNASDRWIENPLVCRPDPAVLLCRPNGPRPCLSPAKLAAARAMYVGARDPRTGARATFPWLPGSEAGWSHYWADPQEPTQPMRVNFWRLWAFNDPHWNWWSFDYGRDLRTVMRRLSPVIDATDPNLSAFRGRGGRLLQYHGLADPVVSPLDTLAYRRAMLKRTDQGRAADWYRLFLVPGMGHCGGGEGFNRFDAQPAMEAWVEQGRPPAKLAASASDGTTRPLCPYPARAVANQSSPGTEVAYRCAIPRPTKH